jgi:hypothetical protein
MAGFAPRSRFPGELPRAPRPDRVGGVTPGTRDRLVSAAQRKFRCVVVPGGIGGGEEPFDAVARLARAPVLPSPQLAAVGVLVAIHARAEFFHAAIRRNPFPLSVHGDGAVALPAFYLLMLPFQRVSRRRVDEPVLRPPLLAVARFARALLLHLRKLTPVRVGMAVRASLKVLYRKILLHLPVRPPGPAGGTARSEPPHGVP